MSTTATAPVFGQLKAAVVAHQDTLSGKVMRVLFRAEDSGFSVLAVEGPGGVRYVIKGTCAPVGEGVAVVADGKWVDDDRFGRQLDASLIRVIQPTGRDGIVAYLKSGVIFGIGPEMAKRIVAHFGDNTVAILDADSARLREVRGIGAKRLSAIRDSWNEQKITRELMVFLSSHGVSPNKANRIFKRFGENAERIVRENPYILAHEVDGIGFLTADVIALKISPELRTSGHRIGAGIVYVLESATSDGHTCLPQPRVIEEAVKILALDPLDVAAHLEKLLVQGVLEREMQNEEAFVYLPALNRSELWASKILRVLAGAPVPNPVTDLDAKITDAEKLTGITLSESQREAVVTAATHRVSVITGGPGVGKTTSLACLIMVLKAAGRHVVLCAPTGRAAKRMFEATRHEAKTIHRTLSYNPRNNGFDFNENNPLPGDVFVVDESSMLDIPIAAKFLRALPAHATLVFIGDVDQLPSVGAGTFLLDLINSQRVATVYLRTIFRQEAASKIILAAHAINSGVVPDSGNPLTDDFMFHSPPRDPGQKYDEWLAGLTLRIRALIGRLVVDRIPVKFGLDPIRDIMVLAPMRRGPLGVNELNRMLQDLLNPIRPGDMPISTGSSLLRPRDRVIQTRNNYQLGVFNGEIGFVVGRDKVTGKARVRFDGPNPDEFNEVECSNKDLTDLALAYAMTIHRAQGSEFPAVVMPMTRSYTVMLARNLIYTGVSRGRKLVVMVGDKSALAMAVKNTHQSSRFSGLLYRLRLPEGATV